MKKLLSVTLGLILLGAGCATQPNKINFTNDNPDSGKVTNFRSLDQAKEDGRLVNEVFFYSVELSDDLDKPLSLDYLKEPNQSNSLRFIEMDSREIASVEVQDPESLTLQHLKDQMELPLIDFANEIWRVNTEDNSLNSDTKLVSTIERTEFAGKNSYQFTITETFKSPRGERHFDQKMVFLFVGHKGLNYIISYPEENETLKSLINSLEFHN